MSSSQHGQLGWAGDRRWFAIIGGQRCRSSFLHQALRRHPQVFAPLRETAYFEDPAFARLTRRDFLDPFADAGAGSVVGFKRPELLGRPEVPQRLAEAMPQARLIVVLREPITRTVSAYFHYVRATYLPLRPLEGGLRTLLSGGTIPGYPHAHEVLAFSRYGEALDRYRSSFDPRQVLVLLESDLDADPAGSMRLVCRHVGVDPDMAVEIGDQPVNEGVYGTGAQMRMLRVASTMVYRREPHSGLMWNRMTRPRQVAHRAIYEASRLIRPRGKPTVSQLTPGLREALADHLEPDVRLLEELIGRRLPGWPARTVSLPGTDR